MSTLSRRADALVDAPALAEYLLEHFARTAQPDYVPLCVAENKLSADDLAAVLARYAPHVPGGVLGYDAMIGRLAFREQLARFMARTILGRPIAAEQLAVVAGAGAVLELLFYALADEGEGVLVPTPSYAGFWPDLQLRDRLRIVPVHGASKDGFRITTAMLDAAMDGAGIPVKALLFTTPNNPMGCMYGESELREIVAWGERRGVHIVFDEIYALSCFGETRFTSVASLLPSLGDRVHVVWAFSKDFAASGLRCGVLVSENPRVIKAIDQLAYWAACSSHTQHVLGQLVDDTPVVDAWIARMQVSLRAAYDVVGLGLDTIGVPFFPAEAGFFVVCDLRAFLPEPTWAGERALWRRLVDKTNVSLTPGEACRIAEPGFFRLCYAAVGNEVLAAALRRIGAVLRAH